jgi:hypothetical protein
MREALVAFLRALGESKFTFFLIDPTQCPDVLPTTWLELTNNGWIRDMDMTPQSYQFTAMGFVEALRVSGLSEEKQFRENLGRVCNVLKGRVKDRTTFSFIPFWDLVKESGLSEAFVQNAIDADLIRWVLGRIGAQWEGEHLIKIPRNFALTLL